MTTVTVTPTPQLVPQGSFATWTVSIGSPVNPGPYTLSLSGLPLGVFTFSSNPITPPDTATLKVAATSIPFPYCPGNYYFTVTASNPGSTPPPPGPDSATSSTVTLAVAQYGPSLHVTANTDKTGYRLGDNINIQISVNRPANGRLRVISPTGSSHDFSYTFYEFGTQTFSRVWPISQSDPIGTWTVRFEADDFCGISDSAEVHVDVQPNTYDAYIQLASVPSQVSVNIQSDNQSQGNMLGSDTKKLSFGVDTTHRISVDQYVPGEAGIRYYCAQNTWTVSSGGSHTFNYETQDLFTVATDPDNVAQVSGGGWFKAGSTVQTNQPPDTVAGPPGTQYVFKGWEVDGVPQSGKQISLTLDKPHKAIAKYRTQYQLVVDSPGGLGDPKGSGFYDAGSAADFSVTSPVGLLVQQVFVRWEGDYSGASPRGSITMDKPKVVHATWTTSYIQLYIVLGAVAAVLVLAAILLWRRRHAPGAPTTKPTPPMPGEAGGSPPEVSGGSLKCDSCGADVAQGQTFCHNCGAKMG